MSRLTFVAAGVAVAVGFLSGAARARGWVEKTVLSDSVTIDVERDGTAAVAHEMLLGLRGGPLPELTVGPIDANSEALGDATATLAKSGTAAGFPIPLAAAVDGTKMALKVQVGKGLRSGTYLVRFRYKTSFGAERLHPTDGGTLVEWSGPSFADGIDSARVVFRFPQSVTLPRAPAEDAASPANVADDQGGVFLTDVRRGSDKDEIEMTRPHVAKGEIVSWRAIVDPGTFDPATEAAPETPPAATDAAPAPPKPTAKAVAPRTPIWIAVGLAAAVYGALVLLKSRWTKDACEARKAAARPLVRAPVPVRAALASLGLFGAGACVIEIMPPLLASASLLVALFAATHLPPRLSLPLRGPGEWVSQDPESALGDRPKHRARGHVLDVTSLLGFGAFLASLGLFVAASVCVLRHSPYHGVALALASSVLFPLFCTGRPSELPPSGSDAPVDLIEWLLDELGGDRGLVLSVIGRVPRGSTEPDELRLLVMPKKPAVGLRAIEVGVDVHDGPVGAFTLPFVIVRTLDGSSAAGLLPKGLYVTRGRGVDERVAVLRPRVPTERAVARLVRDVARRLSLDVPKETKGSQRASSAPSSAGRGSSRAKAGTTSSPAHAT